MSNSSDIMTQYRTWRPFLPPSDLWFVIWSWKFQESWLKSLKRNARLLSFLFCLYWRFKSQLLAMKWVLEYSILAKVWYQMKPIWIIFTHLIATHNFKWIQILKNNFAEKEWAVNVFWLCAGEYCEKAKRTGCLTGHVVLVRVWRNHGGQCQRWTTYNKNCGFLLHQVWQSDHWSDLDNRCALQLFERERCEQHEYLLWRHQLTDCSVEVTLRSDCLGCLSWQGRRRVLIAHMCNIKESARSRQIDEDVVLHTGRQRELKIAWQMWG